MSLSVPNNADMDVSIFFKVKNDPNVPYSLVGVTSISMDVRVKPEDVAAVLHFTTADGSLEIVGDPMNGQIKASKSWTQISHLVGAYVFDVIAQFAEDRRSIYRDSLIFVQGVTR